MEAAIEKAEGYNFCQKKTDHKKLVYLWSWEIVTSRSSSLDDQQLYFGKWKFCMHLSGSPHQLTSRILEAIMVNTVYFKGTCSILQPYCQHLMDWLERNVMTVLLNDGEYMNLAPIDWKKTGRLSHIDAKDTKRKKKMFTMIINCRSK